MLKVGGVVSLLFLRGRQLALWSDLRDSRGISPPGILPLKRFAGAPFHVCPGKGLADELIRSFLGKASVGESGLLGATEAEIRTKGVKWGVGEGGLQDT